MALCGPSRASFLTGIYPWTIGYYIHKIQTPRKEDPSVYQNNVVTYFRSKRYSSYGFGKIFHAQDSSTKAFGRRYFDNTAQDNCGTDTEKQATCTVYNEDVLSDSQALGAASLRFDELSKQPSSRWFMVVGFRRPHLPEAIPRAILSSLGVDDFHFNSSRRVLNDAVPVNAPKYARSATCKTLVQYLDLNINEGVLDESSSTLFKRYYYAGVSYVDGIIGKLLKSLFDHGFKENTVVVIMSDHGYSLGEHGAWCKRSVYDQTTKTSLWIRDPGTAPRTEGAVVSVVDLISTIAELAGVPMSEDYVGASDGRSFAHLVQQRSQTSSELSVMENEPRMRGYFSPYYSAFSVNPVCESSGEVFECEEEMETYDFMAYSFRTEKYRYAEYRKWIPSLRNGDWSVSGKVAAELYDMENDPEETVNVLNSFVDAGVLDALVQGLRAEFVQCSLLSISDCPLESHCTALRGQECIAKINCNRYTMTECPSDYCQVKNRVCKTISASKLPLSLQPSLGGFAAKSASTSPSLAFHLTGSPSSRPSTGFPTSRPTSSPTTRPTKSPTRFPTRRPTKSPTSFPTRRPTKSPTSFPTRRPSTSFPTRFPSQFPTTRPTKHPTGFPSRRPTTARPNS